VPERKTQSETFWREDFAVDDDDINHLYNLFLEDESPRAVQELTLALIQGRCDREDASIQRELARGTMYQPRGTYSPDEQIVFPALDFAVGSVVDEREGHNPEYGDFRVIRVRLEGDEREREFAAQLQQPHRLNLTPEAENHLLSKEELYQRYGSVVQQRLLDRLSAGEEFVHSDDRWLPQIALVEVHVGHRNIAEAVLDINGCPMSPEALLQELDLSTDADLSTQLFSLNYALSRDDRFDDVGYEGQVLWHLQRLEPPEVIYPPRRLLYTPQPYDRGGLIEDLLQLEREIDDECTALIAPPALIEDSVIVTLNYPHRRVGSLPLMVRTRPFFPRGGTQHTLITFVDRSTGKEMPGWVVHQYDYVYGLGEWYEAHGIPVGGYVKLERTGDPLVVGLDYLPQRMKREWVRVANVDDGRLVFKIQKVPISCGYDELMIVGEADASRVDELWVQVEEEGRPIFDVLCEVFPELAKLSPQGTVHAKTLYSAVNIVLRCPPGPIFAALVRHSCFQSVGGGYWAYDESLRGEERRLKALR
jgi:hypothetical protein